MSGDRLYSVMKAIAGRANPEENQTDLLYGLVKTVQPLRVEIENKYTLEEDQLYLSPFCTRKTIRLTIAAHTHSTSDGSTGSGGAVDKVVEIWRGLEVGDKVIMLRHGKGQGFYILQRVGDLT